jgi:hypothetical protein
VTSPLALAVIACQSAFKIAPLSASKIDPLVARIVTPNIFLTFGLAASYPGAGIRDLLNGGAKNWYGGFANLVVKY